MKNRIQIFLHIIQLLSVTLNISTRVFKAYNCQRVTVDEHFVCFLKPREPLMQNQIIWLIIAICGEILQIMITIINKYVSIVWSHKLEIYLHILLRFYHFGDITIIDQICEYWHAVPFVFTCHCLNEAILSILIPQLIITSDNTPLLIYSNRIA